MIAAKNTSNPIGLLNKYKLEAFHAHCLLVEQLFLKPWSENLSTTITQKNILQDWHCVMVDDRPSQQARICILNTLFMTGLQARITVFTTPQHTEGFKALIAPFRQWVDVRTVETPTKETKLGWDGYNQLLKSENFWGQFKEQYILIFQTDALLIQPLELNQSRFSYAGAAWNKNRIISYDFPVYDSDLEWINNEWISQQLCKTTPQSNNGNGGLSIRDSKIMAKICREHSEESLPSEPEDIFFAKHIFSEKYQEEVTLPSQNQLRHLFNETDHTDSHGFHGSWFYLDMSEQANLYEKHIKHIIGIIRGLNA